MYSRNSGLVYGRVALVARKRLLDSYTPFPKADFSLQMPDVSEERLQEMGATVMQLIDINLGNREGLDRSLDHWNAMYEMQTQPRNSPWPDASNIIVPIVPQAIDDLVARICSTVFVPRAYTMRGNDPISAQYAHFCEQTYNDTRQELAWEEPEMQCVHLAARDGLGIMEIMWDISTHEEMRYVEEPLTDQFGNPKYAPDGSQRVGRVPKLLTMVDYDAPRFQAVEFRDFLIIPDYAPSIQAADAVARKIYMSEKDVWRMVRAGVFDKDMAERVLSYDSTGQGELSYDRQGYATYTQGGKLNVADTSVQPPSGVRMQRGPVQIWRVHTRQFDLDGDGVFEENIIWVHDRSRLSLGIVPFEYFGGRPFNPLAIWPRANRIAGFSVAERLRGFQEEANAQESGRIDWMDLLLNPMRYKTRGVRKTDEEGLYPGREIEVDKPDDYGYIPMPDVPQSSWMETDRIFSYADRTVAAPQATIAGGMTGQNRSAKAAQNAMAIQGVQFNMIVARVRKWMLKNFEYAHNLYKQYGPNEVSMLQDTQSGMPTRVAVPRAVLTLNYTLGVAGIGSALDKEGRRNDAMMLYQLLSPSPLVQGNLTRLWQLTRFVVEQFDIPEVTMFLGTLQEAQQQAQQMAQAQQQAQQMQMQMALLNHGNAGKIGGGRPQPQSPQAMLPGGSGAGA